MNNILFKDNYTNTYFKLPDIIEFRKRLTIFMSKNIECDYILVRDFLSAMGVEDLRYDSGITIPDNLYYSAVECLINWGTYIENGEPYIMLIAKPIVFDVNNPTMPEGVYS